ncbi:MAG: hypothetical protein EOP84_03905 [Verrucomicrobiaceae bacterium]|nr:MAG: hypothetical protein EOP84_03905 [Verrucomicrobiaceae bacterium]
MNTQEQWELGCPQSNRQVQCSPGNVHLPLERFWGHIQTRWLVNRQLLREPNDANENTPLLVSGFGVELPGWNPQTDPVTGFTVSKHHLGDTVLIRYRFN